MLSRDLFRNDPDRVRAMLEARRSDAPLDRLIEVDRRWRELLVRVEELKARRNAGSKEVGALYRNARRDEAEARKAELQAIGTELAELDETCCALEGELGQLELVVPNLFHESVPLGADESASRVERTWGSPTAFEFEPQAHWDLGPRLGLIDFERATKIAGARFAVLRGAGAALERALASYMLDLHCRHHGYVEVLPPYLVNAESLLGTGQLPKFSEDLFRVEGSDLYLIPTAEVPVTNLHRDEILE